MYFKRIDMHGFKSFAEPVSIEFHEGITCIVGPNGSGKSNISDAIRWVLGEQSPKMLRGGKMEEVIFAGTASRKSRGMAEVTLVIDNSTGILAIDYNEVAITRRMYRSGESEYAINNNQCRLRDIRELIMDTGIGVDGYSLIGQGKISDIVSNKTESRREIFEEAAGIVMYRTKKAEAERKLASTNANLERVDDIVGEIEGRIGGLKQDSEKAAEYLKLKERYKELEINITLKNVENIELKNEYLKDDISELAVGIDEIKDERVALDKELSENRLRNESLESLSGEARDKLLHSVEEISSLVNQSQVRGEKLSAIENNRKRLETEIAAVLDKLQKEQDGAGGLFSQKEELDRKLSSLISKLDEKVEEYSRMTAALSLGAAEIDGKKDSIFRLHSAISAKNGEAASLESLKGTLKRRKEQLLEEKASAEEANRGVLEQREKASVETSGLEQKLSALLSEAETARNTFNQSLVEERKLARDMEALNISISQMAARKKTIEEMESNYEGYNQAVKYIMKAGLPGIHGVVAELMEVPKGYETAVETALGAALQNIICEDDKSAQRAVLALKENRAGRLTFLPVRSIRGGASYDNRIAAAKGFCGFGTECVSFDEKYRNVFEYLLARVVIVDNMENAVSLSKTAGGGLRFVTLEGEIINSGGAITGGRYRNNTANLLERKAEITALTDKLTSMEEQRRRGIGALSGLRKIMEETQGRASDLEKEGRTVELSLVTRRNQLEAMESSLSDFRLAQEKRNKEFSSIDQEMASADAMIGKLVEEAKSAQLSIDAVTAEIEAALLAHDAHKGDLEAVSEEITKARIAVSSCEGEKNNVDALTGRIQASILELTEEKDRKERELTSLEEEKNHITMGHADIEAVVAEKEEAKAALEEYVRELTEEKATVFARLTEITNQKDGLEEKLSALQSQKYEMEIKQAKNETQLESYKDRLWEEFEISYIQAIEFKKRDFSMNTAVKESREIKGRMKELGEVNVGAIKEYASVSERYEFLTTQRADILEAMGALRQIIEDMDKTIRMRFKESFDAIVANFETIFRELFGGGNAELRLDDETKPLESGIEIIAQPPGKKLQNINLMSGGEKTMTAIALMFAVLKTKPTPFCILDEVEAALDDANIDRFAGYLKNFEGIQFALVTHQKATMEHADVLYGVTMPEQGVSKIISLRMGDDFKLD